MTLEIEDFPEKEVNFTEPVGYSSIPDQFRQKSLEEGFSLNLLVVARRGLGTTTLINSIFNAPLLERERSNEIEISKNEIYENNIKLSIVITTYHGNDTEKVLNHIKERNLEYFFNERGLKVNYQDNRIHACLYLVPIDTIKEEEIEMIRRISKKCNFIPIIPKADIFTPEEIVIYKQTVLQTLKEHEICAYWPSSKNIDDELHQEAQLLISKYPLSTAASENIYEHRGEFFRGRKYKWGFVNVCNPDISDFLDLRRMLAHSFLDDICYQTENVFYEVFRRKCIKDKEMCDRYDNALFMQVEREARSIVEEGVCVRKSVDEITSLPNEEIDAEN